jgi:hypothetical protein
MASLDQLNWEKNNPGIPFNPTMSTKTPSKNMTAEQIRLEGLKESGNISLGGFSSATSANPNIPADKTAAEKILADKKAAADKLIADELKAKTEKGQSAYNILLRELTLLGLGSLVTPLSGLIKQGLSSDEFATALENTPEYKLRFKGNEERAKKGFTTLKPADYLALEDSYQDVMRNYGLPADYYTKSKTGNNSYLDLLIGGNVSNVKLEERLMAGIDRVQKANPQIKKAFTDFYPDIKDGDILAYVVDPKNGLDQIKRKITAAEIGGAALKQTGLTTSLARAEELASYGVDAAAAEQGYATIGGGLERGRQLSAIYQQPAYTQAVAEQEIFNLAGQTEAQQKRKKVIGLEKATFGGQTGVTSGALSQNRAGSY